MRVEFVESGARNDTTKSRHEKGAGEGNGEESGSTTTREDRNKRNGGEKRARENERRMRERRKETAKQSGVPLFRS